MSEVYLQNLPYGTLTSFSLHYPRLRCGVTYSNLPLVGTAKVYGVDRENATRRIILSVEDDEAQGQLRREILEKDGYSVLTATTLVQAVRVFRENPVCLVVADHMLQGPVGADLAQNLKQIKPEVPVLLYSGNSPGSMRHIDAFLHKGEPVSRFLGMIRSLVDRYCA